MTDTFATTTSTDADSQLPPLSAAIRKVWRDPIGGGAPISATPSVAAMRAIFHAVAELEQRVIDLES